MCVFQIIYTSKQDFLEEPGYVPNCILLAFFWQTNIKIERLSCAIRKHDNQIVSENRKGEEIWIDY